MLSPQSAATQRRAIGFRPEALFLWLVAGFLVWPKYVSIDLAFFRLNPVILLIVILLGWAAGRFLNPFTRDRTLEFDAFILLGLFLVEWGLRFLSDLRAPDPTSSMFLTLRDLIWSASIFVIAFQFGGGPANLTRIIWVLTISGLVIASLGVMEYYTQTFVATSLINGLHLNLPDDYLSVLTMDKTRNGGFRIQSVFTHPLVLGEVLAALAPVFLSAVLIFQSTRRILAVMAFALCLFAVYLTGSRASQVAAIVALAAYVALAVAGSRSLAVRLLGLIGLPLATAVAIFTLYPVVAELQAGRNAVETQSSAARAEMWARGTPQIIAKPLLGHGDGQALRLASIQIGNGFTVDDLYLSLLINFGIIYMAVLGLLVLGCIAVTFRESLGRREHQAAIGLAAGIFGIIVGQKATSIFEGMGVLYLFCGLLAGLRRRTVGSRLSLRPMAARFGTENLAVDRTPA